MHRTRLREAGAVLLAALLLCAFWKLRLSDSADQVTVYSRDAYQQIYPMWVFAADSLRRGELPLWDPYQMAGHPFLASVLYGVFYPLNFPRYVLPVPAAMEATLVLHLVAAWAFMLLYARSIGLRGLPAYCAATAFALSGNTVLNAVWFLPAIGAIVWLPLALFAVEKLVAEPRPRWAALLSLAVAMPILAGWLQDWLHLMQAVGLYAGVRLLAPLARREWSRAGTIVGWTAFAAVLGLALAAVQLLPSAELQSLGWRRPGGLTVEQTLPGGVSLASRWISEAARSEPGYPRYGYYGIAAVVLLPLSLLAMRGSSAVAGLWAVGLWGLLVAMTLSTPAFALYRALPGGTWFREPWRIIVLTSFATAALSGVALDHAARASRRTGILAAVAATVLAAMWAYGTAMPERTHVLLAVAVVLLWITALVPRPWRRVPIVLTAMLLVGDLFLASWVISQRPYQNLRSLDGEAPLFDFIRRSQGLQRTYLFHPWPFEPEIMAKQGTLRGVYMITDYEILSLERHARYYAAIEAGQEAPPIAGFIGMLRMYQPTDIGVRLLTAMGVRFVVAPKGHYPYDKLVSEHGWRAPYLPIASGYNVFENPRALPRAYLSYNRAVIENDEDALQILLRRSFDPWATVVIEQRADAPVESVTSRPYITPVTPVEYGPTNVVIDVFSERDAMLILTDSDYPGWTAYVDGVESPIYHANYLFRAVHLGPGWHQVRFRFVPRSLYAGAAISIVAAIGCLAIVFATRGGRRSEREGSTFEPAATTVQH